MNVSADRTNTDVGLIRPMRRITDPSIGPNALQILIGKDLEDLVRQKGPDNFERFHLDFFKLYRLGQKTDEPSLSLFGPFLGAPQAVMGLEKMIALGARKIWVFGWCGSLRSDLEIGDIVIPTGALIEEGTSQHYPLNGRVPATDPDLNDRLETALKTRAQSFQKGRVWTTDAPYRETPSKITAYRDMGILAVEMEMSALMTVALYRGVRLAGLLVVSDGLAGMKWHHGFTDPRFKKATRAATGILFDLASGADRLSEE